MDKVSERVIDIKAIFLFSISVRSPIFNDQCNSLLSKPILARTLNSWGIELANISENIVLANISKSTVSGPMIRIRVIFLFV